MSCMRWCHFFLSATGSFIMAVLPLNRLEILVATAVGFTLLALSPPS